MIAFFFFGGGGGEAGSFFFYKSMGAHDPGVVVANLNPRGMVGRVYIVNRYALINANHRSCRQIVFNIYSPLYSISMEAYEP